MPATKTRTRSAPPPPPPIETEIEEEDVIPEIEKRKRTPKLSKLEDAVSGLYIMMGGAVSTLPEQVAGTRIKVIGLNVAQSSDEIASAWIDLAEDDKRVLKALESLTSFSGWGKVVGVHLMAVGTAVPGIAATMQQPQQRQQQSTGSVDPQTAAIVAEMFRQSQSQVRAERSPIFEEPIPSQPVQEQRQHPQEQQSQVRRSGNGVKPGRNAGIPSAADLGVTIADVPADFPTSGPENING